MDDERRALDEAYRLLEGVQGDAPDVALDAADPCRAVRRAPAAGRTSSCCSTSCAACTASYTDQATRREARSRGAADRRPGGIRRRARGGRPGGARRARRHPRRHSGSARRRGGGGAPARRRRPAGVRAQHGVRRGGRRLQQPAAVGARRRPLPAGRPLRAQRPVRAPSARRSPSTACIVRVEWALALSEVGREEESREQLRRAAAAVDAARSTRDAAPVAPGRGRRQRRSSRCWRTPSRCVTSARWPRRSPACGRWGTSSCCRCSRRRGRSPCTEPATGAGPAPPRGRCRSTPRRRPVARPSRRGCGRWCCAGRRPSSALRAQAEHIDRLAAARWDARLGMLDAARAQIDVSRRRAEREQLLREATTDALTGLRNRRVFDTWLAAGRGGAGRRRPAARRPRRVQGGQRPAGSRRRRRGAARLRRAWCSRCCDPATWPCGWAATSSPSW